MATTRRALLFLGAGLILAAVVVVPLPLVAIEPGVALPVPPRVKLGIPPHPVHGQLLLTAVRLGEPSAAGAAAAWLDPDVDVMPRPAVIPPGVDEREYIKAQERLFQESAQVAAAVGLSLAGQPVQLSGGGAQVAGVIRGSPAEGKLREGDVITSVNGRPVRLASDVAEATARAKPGDTVTVTFRRGDETGSARIELRQVNELGRPGLGVALRTVDFAIRLPFPVEIDQGQIGGPSAGLMMALSVYDLTDPGDLVKGRTIAGTGTVDIAGHVGAVGGVRQKVKTAQRAGATVFLVPVDEAAEARRAARPGLVVTPVATVREAVAALDSGNPPARLTSR
jgi:PDZ domain-containing protein